MEIKAYFKYTFVKDTSMRGIIISKSEEESTNNITTFMNETKKVMKTYGGASDKGEEVGKDADTA